MDKNEVKSEITKKEKPILTETQLKKRKAHKTRLTVSAFVILLAVGVMGNWYYENSDMSKSISPLISSNNTKTLGEAEYVDATTQIQETTTENEYFSNARVERQSARDSALEELQSIVDSVDESEQSHSDAEQKIASITSYITIENKIETLVTAKGVNNCIAVVNEDGTKVDVIVDAEDLTNNLVVQIKEIAIEQLGCSYSDVTIIQSK